MKNTVMKEKLRQWMFGVSLGLWVFGAVGAMAAPVPATLPRPDGKEVYRRNPGEAAVLTKVTLEQGKRYPVGITYLKTGSAAFRLEQVDLKGKGDLATCIAAGKFPWFAEADGKWTLRNDVTYREVRLSQEPFGSGGPLSATSNGGRFIGPEVPFGFVMGTYHDEPVLLIESSIGNRSLNWDFRPPSSGKTDRPGAAEWEGTEYRLMVEGVHKVLKLKGGKVTLAIISFLRYTHFRDQPAPHNGHVSLWLEEAKLPPAAMKTFEANK